MALVKCSECGHEVAEHAFSCPNCGAHDPSKTGAKFLKGCFITIGVIITVIVMLISYASASESENSVITAAKKQIESEPKVVELLYDPKAAVQWHIGVIDDGSKRYGYASYICDILHEHSLISQNTSVRIVDISEVNRGETFRKASLGRVNCSTYQNYDP